jgi:hypothetical protein
MRHRTFALLFGAVLACAAATQARAAMFDRLQQQHFGDIAPGSYQAGDKVRFTLDRYQNQFLMRFAGQPEVYVLYADFASLGGRVLRYDSGGVAIQVTGWGALTIYTDNAPDGLPTSRIGESTVPALAQISMQQMQSAAEDESSHLTYVRGLHITFFADPNTVADGPTRALAFDAMENTARGIDRFTANSAARAAFSQRVNAVRLQISAKPFIKISDKTLIVTFNPQTGYLGRASSRAIAFALGKMFGMPVQN